MKNLMEQFYKRALPNKVFWDKAPAHFFETALDNKNISIGTALDLGTGTGKKAIQLAQRGFKVTALDISPTVIEHAKKQSQKASINVNFITKDVTNLSFLKNETFDLILDWGCLHHIPVKTRKRYISEVKRVCKKGGHIILRCFSKHKISPGEIGFLTPFGIIYLFSLNDIKKLYRDKFETVKTNRSPRKEYPYRWFEEVLLRKTR